MKTHTLLRTTGPAACLLAALAAAAAACGNGKESRDATTERDAPPLDTSGDWPEIPCDQLVDTDGDTIADQHEGTGDTDGDTIPNHLDTDSDDDGFPDADEAGDTSLCTPPTNSDDDAIADFIDGDSDNDGLGDREEATYSTNPYNPDTDGDGYSDLAEVATGHDPKDAADIIPSDDFYVILPFEGDPQEKVLEFHSAIRKADIYFVMDTTGSMSEEANNLASGLRTMIPQLRAEIPDVGIGCGHFEDFNINCGPCPVVMGIPTCYGVASNKVYYHFQDITTNEAAAQAGVDQLKARAGTGGCNWASSLEALYQIATGAGIAPFVPPKSCPLAPDEIFPRVGYPCFRPGALPIVVVLTDTASRSGPCTTGPNTADGYYDVDFPTERPHRYDAAVAELNAIGARVLGVISGAEAGDPSCQFQSWARDTGTVNPDGSPLLFPISSDGTLVTSSIVDAIKKIAGGTPQDVDAVTQDQIPDDPPQFYSEVNAAGFVTSIVAKDCFREDGTVTTCTVSPDGASFVLVPPGYLVRFTVTFHNGIVREIGSAQVYRATIVVRGNHVANLDEREVIIIIPASSEVIFV